MPQGHTDRRDEAPELATVFTTRSPALLGLAQAVLASADIPFVTKGELISAERDGDLEIQVRREEVVEARALLTDIQERRERPPV